MIVYTHPTSFCTPAMLRSSIQQLLLRLVSPHSRKPFIRVGVGFDFVLGVVVV